MHRKFSRFPLSLSSGNPVMAASKWSPMTGDPLAEDRLEFRSLGGNKPKTEIIAIRETTKIKVMVIGCTGRGKTTFCNFLFREERFKSWKHKPGKKTGWRAAMSDVNRAEKSEIDDRMAGVTLTVIDTPGYLATQHRGRSSKSGIPTDADELLKEFSRALMHAKDGVDAVLVTLRCGDPASMEEEMLLEFITEMKIWKHCIILFTHGERVSGDEEDVEGYLEFYKGLESGEFAKECPVLSQFVESCERRFMIVESVDKANDYLYYRSKLDELYAAVKTVRKNAKSPFNHPLLEMAKNSYRMVQMQKCLRAEANDKEAELEAAIKEKDQVVMRLSDKEAELEATIREKDQVTTLLGDKETQLKAAIKEKDQVTTRLGDKEKRFTELKGAIESDPPKINNDARAEQDAEFEGAAAILLQYLFASEATDANPTPFVSEIRRLESVERRQRETMDKLGELLDGIRTEKKKKLPRADLERELETVMTPEKEKGENVEANAAAKQPGGKGDLRGCNLL